MNKGTTELVRAALLAKGPNSSLGDVHRGSCSEPIHIEDEVKDQEDGSQILAASSRIVSLSSINFLLENVSNVDP